MVTGMRRGEAVGLRWEDVDLDGRCLFIVQQIVEVNGRSVVGTPKTKRGSRVLPIDDSTVRRLREHQMAQRAVDVAWGRAPNHESLVFTRADGRSLRPEYVTRHFQRLAHEAGLPVIRLHDLRHTHASLALAAGVDIKVVSDRLGHATTAITADLYTHVSRGVGRKAADRIADVLAADANAMQTQDPRYAHTEGNEEARSPPTKKAH
jgi:integrase